MVVLELLHLKMEVTVSEACDVIRVVITVLRSTMTFNAEGTDNIKFHHLSSR